MAGALLLLNLNLKLPAPRSSSVSYLDNNDNSSSSTFNLNCEHPPQHALLPASVPHQPHPSRRRHDSPLFCFLMSDYHLPRNRAIAQSDCATPASIEHGSSMNGSRTPPPARSGRRSSRGTVLLSPIPLSWVVFKYVSYQGWLMHSCSYQCRSLHLTAHIREISKRAAFFVSPSFYRLAGRLQPGWGSTRRSSSSNCPVLREGSSG